MTQVMKGEEGAEMMRDGEQSRAWLIIGAGRLGRMMGLMARALGVELACTWNRDEQGASETAALLDIEKGCACSGPLTTVRGCIESYTRLVIWVTVVDDVIEEVVRQLVDWVEDRDVVLVHTAGSLSSTLFREVGVRGDRVAVASLHPLQAIADPVSGFEMMGECVWTLEGDAEARAYLMRLMSRVGVVPLEIESGEAKVMYHASAVTAANLLVALMDAAYEMARAAGLSMTQAREMLLPLARSSLENLGSKSPAEALTGPAARGDAGTIARHEQALERHDEGLLVVYSVLTQRAWELMERESEVEEM